MVQRILVFHVETLKPVDRWRRQWHALSDEMNGRSSMVNMGVFPSNPSNTSDTIDIMDRLRKYVPVVKSQPCSVPTHGDGLTIE